jgi:hypothetical protein
MCSLTVNTAAGVGGISAIWCHAISVIVVFYISNEMLDIKYDFSCKRLRLCSSKVNLLNRCVDRLQVPDYSVRFVHLFEDDKRCSSYV